MADKKFTVEFDVNANLGNIKSAAEQLQTIFNKLPANLKQGTDATFKNLLKDLEELQHLSANGVIPVDKVKTAQRLFDRISASVDKLNTQTGKIRTIDAKKLLSGDALTQFKQVEEAVKTVQRQFKEGFKTDEIVEATDKLKDLNKEAKKIKNESDKISKENSGLGGQKGGLTNRINNLQKKLDTGLESGEIKKNSQEYKELTQAIKEANKEKKDLDAQINKNKNQQTDLDKQYEKAQKAITECKNGIKELQAAAGDTALANAATRIQEVLHLDEAPVFKSLQELENYLRNLPEQQVKEIGIDLGEAGQKAEQCAEEIKPIDDELIKASSAAENFTEREKEMAQVANQVKQFFSIGNTIQLFKRAIRSAFDTIKELDEVMTQTAVVTDFTVGDMWNQLPEYTKRANELGVSVKGAYEAATLYYQQGLKTNQVIGVSNETLKMAKIAGIEYATATDYMTSALRGFNMEVNEDSARKVNDIYSELAAVTAADTAELSIAMSKTASLASNAGMQIETTTALLAKMIETTREAPETLGTAMKTVIARFQELKKDPALIEPVDGEIVDANKIEAALRTIDVALRDSSGQFRDLDGVFLDIAEKWDSLDTNTQRYIATIAAGSRQQSRFIAMMTDYPRTMELVDAANTSAGASQRQFEKTLDSMASALDRLKNAWNEFVMGLANNQIVKGVIDAIRMFIKAVADLTDMLSFGSGFLKSFWNLGALLGGIKLAKAAFTGFFGWLTKSGKEAGRGTGTALGNGILIGVNKVKNLLAKTTWITPKDLENQLSKGMQVVEKMKKVDFLPERHPAIQNYQKQLRELGVNTETYNYLVAQGVKENVALEASIKGVTLEEAKETVATKANTEAERAANTEKARGIAFGKVGIVTRIKNIALLMFSTKATNAQTFAQLAHNAAIKEGTLSYRLLAVAMKGLPLGWILGGVAAIVAIVAVLAKFIKQSSLSYQLEQAKEATDNAKKSAEEAKAAYDDLLESKTGFDELQQSLKDLTYGTLEWRQALLEANQQVIDLIDKYPQLVNYLQEGEYGQLTISAEGWDTLLERQLANVRNAQGAQVIAQARENRLNNQVAAIQYNQTDISGLSRSTSDAIKAELKLGKPIDELIEKYNLTEVQASEAVEAIGRYNNAIKENELATESAAASYIKMTATEAGLEGTAADYLASGLNSLLTNGNFEGAIKKNDITDTDTFNELVDTYGIRSQLTGDLTDNLERLYAAMTNQAEEDVEDLFEGDRNKLKQAIADVANADKFNQFTAEAIKAYQTADEDQRKALDMAMSEGSAFINELDTLSEKQAKELYNANESFYKLFYDSAEDFAKAYTEAVDNGKVDLEEARSQLGEYGIWDDEIFVQGEGKVTRNFGENLSAGAISGLSNNLVKIFEVSGRDAAQALAEQINSITSNINTKDAEQFAATLNSITWDDKDSVKTFSDKIEELGIETGLSEEEIDNLETEIMLLAKASKQVDLEKLIDQIKSLGKIQLDLRQGTQGRSFSEDTYNTLIENGIAKAKDFVYSLETGEYIYTGRVNNLISALDENTAALLGTTDIERQIASSEAAQELQQEIVEGTVTLDVNSIGSLAYVLQDYLDKAGQNSIFHQDQLDMLINSKDIESLQNLWNSVVSEGWALESRLESYNGIQAQARAIEYQNRNTGDNMGGIRYTEDFSVGSEGYASAQALIEQGRAAGVSTAAINDLANALTNGRAEEIKMAAEIVFANTAVAKQNKAIQDLSSSYDTWSKVLKNLPKDGIKGLTGDDAQAIDDMILSVHQLLGLDPGTLGEDFFEVAENVALIERAAYNDIDAIEQLRKNAADSFDIKAKLDLDDFDSALAEFQAIVDNYEPGTIVAESDLDNSAFFKALQQLALESQEATNLVNGYLRSMGYDVVVEYEPVDASALQKLASLMSLAAGGGAMGKVAAAVGKAYSAMLKVPKIRTVAPNGGGSTSPSYSAPSGGSGGGGGGGSSSSEEWKNPYDWLYNLTKKINAELRIREKLERRYQRLLKQYAGSGAELKAITDKEIASLEKRKKLQEEMLRLRKQEAQTYLGKNQDLAKYATIDWDLEEVQINWDLIDAIKDTELGEKVEEYVSKLEELISQMQDATDAIEDIDDELIEIKERGKEQYRDLEDRVLDALISERQQQIDEQERIYKAITDAASDLTDSIQKNIDKIRQDRQNEETETSLAEKERRLAYLRQDTTGSNALEIKKLEKELADEKQNYTDSLIDQSLNDLKEQNDAAAKQRDKQIELMQSELDWREKTGYYVQQATDIVRDGLGPNGVIDKSSRMYELLREQEDVSKLSNASRDQWFRDLSNTIAEAFVWFSNGMGVTGEGENRNIMSEMIARVNQGKAVNTDMSTLANLEDERNAKIAASGSKEYPQTDMVDQYEAGKAAYKSGSIKDADIMKTINDAMASGDWKKAFKYAGARDQKLIDDGSAAAYASDWTFQMVFDKWYNQTKGKAYKRGGLVDFTGPAWLDGTKSKPEMVLNAKDTENLIQLKNILAGLNSGIVGKSDAQGGDWYFDIDVNVGEIANDYDVDRVAERVKQSIYTEATYRNVNAIKFLK